VSTIQIECKLGETSYESFGRRKRTPGNNTKVADKNPSDWFSQAYRLAKETFSPQNAKKLANTDNAVSAQVRRLDAVALQKTRTVLTTSTVNGVFTIVDKLPAADSVPKTKSDEADVSGNILKHYLVTVYKT